MKPTNLAIKSGTTSCEAIVFTVYRILCLVYLTTDTLEDFADFVLFGESMRLQETIWTTKKPSQTVGWLVWEELSHPVLQEEVSLVLVETETDY